MPRADQRARVLMMFHPTEHVTDLDEAEEFYQRVFGQQSIRLSSVMSAPPQPGHATDYSTFTLVREVLFDSLDPKRYVTDGVQRYPDIERAHLKTLGWYVADPAAVFAALKRHGIRVTNGKGEVVDGDEPPKSGALTSFHALPADAGIRYHFFPPFPFPADPRQETGWTLSSPSPDDPLGLEFCAHHVILTERPERALKLVVDVLGGEIIHTGHDELRGITGSYVRLGDAVLYYAVPDPGTAAHRDLAANGPDDVYHAVTWKVTDLERAERRLESVGVQVQARSQDTIITDPSSSLGIPWGFTTAAIPGDARVLDQERA